MNVVIALICRFCRSDSYYFRCMENCQEKRHGAQVPSCRTSTGLAFSHWRPHEGGWYGRQGPMVIELRCHVYLNGAWRSSRTSKHTALPLRGCVCVLYLCSFGATIKEEQRRSKSWEWGTCRQGRGWRAYLVCVPHARHGSVDSVRVRYA